MIELVRKHLEKFHAPKEDAKYPIVYSIVSGCLGAFCLLLLLIPGFPLKTVLFFMGMLLITGSVLLFFILEHYKKTQITKLQFEEALIHALKTQHNRGFKFDAFIEQTGVSRRVANKVARKIFSRICDQAVADGIITENESANLKRLGEMLGIPIREQARYKSLSKEKKYKSSLDVALQDHQLSDEEIQQLEALRRNLGLSHAEISRASGETGEKAYRSIFRQTLRKTGLSQQDLDDLAARSRALGLTEGNSFAVVKEEALDLFREEVFEAKQDGCLTPEKEQALINMQQLLRLNAKDVKPYWEIVDRIRYLMSIREGNLHSVTTNKMLQGGEICHMDCACSFQYQTKKNTHQVTGEISLTDQRVIFTSPVKNFEFKPSKIVNIEPFGNAVFIQTSGSSGTGTYFLQDQEVFAAVMEALARKQKFLAAENFEVSRSRHIPDHVKQEVWRRDGGKCVRCSAVEYLEFDHIIPHSKGGANTEGNIQLLCRKCNLSKSDRI